MCATSYIFFMRSDLPEAPMATAEKLREATQTVPILATNPYLDQAVALTAQLSGRAPSFIRSHVTQYIASILDGSTVS